LEKDWTFPTLFSPKTPKLGLAVLRACAEKSSECTPQKHQT
jgi:hypothetical protein